MLVLPHSNAKEERLFGIFARTKLTVVPVFKNVDGTVSGNLAINWHIHKTVRLAMNGDLTINFYIQQRRRLARITTLHIYKSPAFCRISNFFPTSTSRFLARSN